MLWSPDKYFAYSPEPKSSAVACHFQKLASRVLHTQCHRLNTRVYATNTDFSRITSAKLLQYTPLQSVHVHQACSLTKTSGVRAAANACFVEFSLAELSKLEVENEHGSR